MEKMDMAWFSIRSNLILPLSPSPSVSASPPGCTHRPPQQEVRVRDSRAPADFCQSLHVSILQQQAATQWMSSEQKASLTQSMVTLLYMLMGFIVFLFYRAGCVICEDQCTFFVSHCWCLFIVYFYCALVIKMISVWSFYYVLNFPYTKQHYQKYKWSKSY